jgi:hypothetical protein
MSDDEKQQSFGDPELDAMFKIFRELQPLPQESRTRVLTWVKSKTDELNKRAASQ